MDLLLRLSAFLASLRVTQSKIVRAVEALHIPPSSNLEFHDPAGSPRLRGTI